LRLSDLNPGQKATIKQINQPNPTRRRIMEMGLTRGSQIQIICRAPLGDPIEIETHDYKLTLRKKEADNIIVETQP
jgi:ferrous iron transport protein A